MTVGANDDLGRFRANQTPKSEVGKRLDISVVALIKGIIEIQHQFPVI